MCKKWKKITLSLWHCNGVFDKNEEKLLKRKLKMKNYSYLLLLTYVLVSISQVSSVRIHYIHWNSSSPIFRDPSSSHVIEIRGGRRDQPWDYEQVNTKYIKSLNNKKSRVATRYLQMHFYEYWFAQCNISTLKFWYRTVHLCIHGMSQLTFCNDNCGLCCFYKVSKNFKETILHNTNKIVTKGLSSFYHDFLGYDCDIC